MLNIGLTGGIGAGKSTAGKIFAELGATLIDTDSLARLVVQPGTFALSKIIVHFGDGILQADGQLNRALLREKIFDHPQDRIWLEQLLHPLIREKMAEQIAASQGSYNIILIPLVVNQPPNPLLHRICVIDADPSIQQQRVILRDKSDPSQIAKIIAAQAQRGELLAIADDVIVNNKDLAALKEQVIQLHQKYLAL